MKQLDKKGWKIVRFEDVCRNLNVTVKSPEENGYDKVIGLENIESGNLHIKTWGDIAEGTTFTKTFEPGHVLFGKRRAYLKKAAVAEFKGLCSGDILVFEAISKVLHPKLLPFIVSSDRFFEYAIKTSAGSLSPRTKFQDLSNFEFSLPPIDQQEKLAELLWAGDKTISSYILLRAKIAYQQQILIENLFVQEGKNIHLKNLGSLIRGVGYKPEDLHSIPNSETFTLLRSNNILDGQININDVQYISNKRLSANQILNKNDICICMSNGSKDLVGKAAQFNIESGHLFSVGSFCAIFRPKNEFKDLVKFLFQSASYRSQIKNLISGSNINNLKPSDIESLNFNMNLDIKLDNAIALIKEVDAQKGQIDSQIELLKVLQSNLINNMIDIL